MINRTLSKIALALAASAFVSVAQAKPTLKEVTEATEAAAAKAPDQAAQIVEDKVKATPEYACPIIKAAIKGAKLQKEEETDLVAAALKAAPERAPEIRACLAQGNGKHPISSKGPVKTPETVETPEGTIPGPGEGGETWNQFSGVVGTYLAVPASGGTGTGTETPTVVTTTTTVVEEVPQRVFVPVTGS